MWRFYMEWNIFVEINHNTSKTQSKNIKEMLKCTSNTKFSFIHLYMVSWQSTFFSYQEFSIHPYCRFLPLLNGKNVSQNHFLPQKQMSWREGNTSLKCSHLCPYTEHHPLTLASTQNLPARNLWGMYFNQKSEQCTSSRFCYW